MKKLLLIFLFFATAITGAKAQLGGGYDSAFNFGGAGNKVVEMRYDASGNLFFIATAIGKNLFAGTQIDPGGLGSYPLNATIYGKIAPNGTQTLLKSFSGGDKGVLDADGNLTMILTAGFPTAPVDFGNGIINNTNGVKILRINNTGVAQWIKLVNTGSDVLSGETGKANTNLQGLQTTPDGNIFAVVAANNPSPNPPTAQFTMPSRIIKFDSNGDEVWHTEVFSTSTSGTITVPKIFVDDAGRVTFSINSTTNQFYYNGENIASQMGVYSFGQSQYTIVISLNADGSKKSIIADKGTNAVTTFSGLNPISGDLYIGYAIFANSKSTQAPFNNFPLVQTTAPFSGGGTLIFNSSGQFLNYKSGQDFQPTLASTFRDGNKFVSIASRTANVVYERENYVFNSAEDYAVLEFLDQDFNFVKALKTPKISNAALHLDKASISGEFKTSVTFGNTTLTANFNDTDFGIRFPFFASIKQDMFIAAADAAVIAPPLAANWLGVDNNWNNTANWSSSKVPDVSTIVRFNNTTANMPTTATTPTALKVIIDAGVTAQLPTALVIKNKLIINGTLQVNHTGTLNFTNYSATAIEGTGTLAFNGTGVSSVNAFSLIGFKDLSLSTNENITIVPGVYKNITFTGTNAIITASAGIEITNPNVNAISGHSATNYIAGPITRAVNSNGVYVFPNAQFNYLKPEPTTITLNNITGTTKIKVANDNSAGTPNINFASGTTTSVLGDYYWKITSDVAPTGGTYNVSFSKSVFSNGVTDDNRYVVINRIATGNPWSFDGTKTTSTQTGGTTSGQTVSNATVVAGLTGLTKFSEFTIGINSTPVATNTSVTASTWTGGTNTEWNNAGNWSAGIPNGTINATIPAGLTNYPSIYTATDNAKSLTIAAGISNMKLSHVLKLTNGLVNNSTIEIAGLVGYGGQFKAYDGGISGSGKLVFKNGGLISSLQGGVFNNDIDIDLGSTIYDNMTILGKIGGNINVISGAINALRSAGIDLELTNPSSTITIASPINHIAGTVYKSVNASGSYTLPIGDERGSATGFRKYGEIAITNNAIAKPTVYAVKFSSSGNTAVALTSGSDVYTSFINSGQWFITPADFSTTGTIDLVLKTADYTNGRASTADYGLLRKGAGAWELVSGATITQIGDIITVSATGLAPFSANTMFCIGLKATTTTWTGAAGTADWNTAGNWSNGMPTSEVKAIIANVTTGRFYPNNAPANGFATAAIEIAEGSTLTLPTAFYSPNGIVNNGIITVSGSGAFYGFGSGSTFSTLSGTGKIVFGTSSPTTFESYYVGNTLNNSVEINNPAGLTLVRPTTFTGNVTLTNGSVIVPDLSYAYFIMNNPNATITGSASGYIKGVLKRTVNASGTYNFPVGSTTAYAPASLVLTGLVGTTDISTSFGNTAIDGQPNLTIGSNSVNNILIAGSWKINPNLQPTAGSYGVTLSASLGSSTATDFYVLKRTDNYSFYPWANQGTNVASTLNAGVVTASSNGLTSFSQFGIGEGVSTLPVKLTVFSAVAVAKSAKLYWETASELNNDKFEIERSINGTEYIKIGEVKGSGTSKKLNTYSFRDLAPSNGANYYRLKQLDLNGNSEYSEVRVVKSDLKDIVFNIYPNPATDGINFSETVKSVEIYSISGAQVFRQIGAVSNIKFPSSIKNGVYIVRATLADGSVVARQIIIR